MDISKDTTSELIDKKQWAGILERMVDVLRINIFIVDQHGKTILPPQKGRYGWDLLSSAPIGFDLLNEHSNFIDKFRKHGFYLEYSYQFDLHSFAIPINIEDDKTIAYIIVGPVILNKRLEKDEYRKAAEAIQTDVNGLLEEINEIRVLTFVGIKSILDLLDEVSRYIVQLRFQQRNLQKRHLMRELLPQELRDTAQSIYSSIHIDELLIAFLDTALKLTKTECGSVMVIDDEKGDLVIRVSRGIDNKIAQSSRVKIGEGVAGLAARDKSSFVLHGASSDDQNIQPFLKRPEIKHALITPLATHDKLFGILNLHTKNEENDSWDANLNTAQALAQLTAVALSGIQQKISESEV